jgi:hypothetical protein
MAHIKSRITLAIEIITPDIAYKYLATNDHNRRIRQNVIDHYCALIESGRFCATHQGCAFHLDGRLVDGQHRLWAVILTGKTVEMVVARGLDDAAVAAIDGGLARSYGDHGHYQGWDDATPIASGTVKWLVGGPGYRNRRVPPDVLHMWQTFYAGGVDYALEAFKKVRTPGKRLTAPMCAAIARAWYSMDGETLDRFIDTLTTGQRAFEADNAAVVLRDAWLAGRLGSMTDQYLKTQGALRAFKERRGIRTLQRPDKDLFVIPKLPRDERFEIKNTLAKRLELQSQMAQ